MDAGPEEASEILDRQRPTTETFDFGSKVSQNDIHSHSVGAGPQQQQWKLNRDDKHGNADAIQLNTTQKLLGHQPTIAWNFEQQT